MKGYLAGLASELEGEVEKQDERKRQTTDSRADVGVLEDLTGDPQVSGTKMEDCTPENR